MKSLSIFARGFCLVLVIFLVSTIHASTPQEQVPFDLQQVVEQVTHHPRIDGNTIRINGKYYEAQFEKNGIVLTERNSKNRRKIWFDEETGDMKIADDEVRYNSADGLFSVKGKKQGLQFRKEIKENSLRSMKGGFRYRFRTEGKEARIGEILVTDASGNRFKPEVAKKHDEIEILIPKKDQSKLKFPLTLLGEFMIDTTTVGYPSYEWEESSCSVAFDGTNFFVVWGNNDLEAVIGTRVSPTGEVLDKAGIMIMEETTINWMYGERPSVSFNGENYLVVWSDAGGSIYGFLVCPEGNVLNTEPLYLGEGSRPSTASDGSNFLVVWSDWGIHGVSVSNSGIILDSILICTAASNPFEPSVCFGESVYLVTWQDYRNGNQDIFGARLNTSGTVLDPAGIAISIATGSQQRPAVTFGSGNYFIVWDDYRSGVDRDIYGARVTQTGSVLDPSGIAISTATDWQWFTAVAFDGLNYFAVWLDNDEIYGTRITASGTVLDPSSILITTTGYPGIFPSVTFGINNYLVVWTCSYYDIYGARVNTAGTVLDTSGILLSMQVNEQYYSQVAFDGTSYLVVWQDVRGDCDIYGARVTPSGLVLDPAGIPISDAIDCQHNPQVIFGGNNFFVIWEDWRNGDLNIYGTRVSVNGTVLDPTGIPICTAAGWQRYPQVVFGSDYFVVWLDWRSSTADIYGARVSTSGTVLDPLGIPISNASDNQGNPKVVFGGNNYFTVWEDLRSGTNVDIYGARVNLSGTVLDPTGIPISTASNYQGNLQLILGSDYFVVWEDNRDINSHIYGARINTTGTVLDPTGIPICTASGIQGYPQVVFGSDYFVVWVDCRNDPDGDIYGTRINTAGNVLDPTGIPISTASYDQSSPQVVFDGADYMVAWEDNRDGDWDLDIFGAKVTATGTVTEFAVSTLTGDQSSIALAKGSGNQVFVVWDGWTPRHYNADRVWGKLIPTPGYVPWIAMNSIPLSTTNNKRVKGGGALAAVDNSSVFALKGNNTNEFYCYDVDGHIWIPKESVPYNPDKPKRVKTGAALIYDGNNLIYATKGNNTLEWLCYNTVADTWRHLKPVPSLKGLKGGTGLAKVNKNGVNGIFLLKGSKSSENFVYFPNGDSWQRLPDAPVEFKKGSCAVGYDDSIVYVLKDKYNLLYRVNIQTGTWTLKDTVPFVGILRKKKKIKDGASLAFDGSNTIFAFKGGNTQEFWAYNIATNNWAELETIPRGLSKKRVKSGGSLAYLGGAVYALKGSNTDEFWMYAIAKTPMSLAGQSEITSAKIESPKFNIFPNPSNGKFTIEYNSVLAKPSKIKIYNILGAIVWETANELKMDKLSFDLSSLAQGVYILRLENEDFKLARKLIIQK